MFLHEPHAALFAKEKGLGLIKKLIAEAPRHLNLGGTIYVEFGEDQKEKIEKITAKIAFATQFEKDVYGKWRVVKLTIP